jgi:hypothetical protein
MARRSIFATGDEVQEPQLVILDVAPGAAMETQSGLQANFPRIYGALAAGA